MNKAVRNIPFDSLRQQILSTIKSKPGIKSLLQNTNFIKNLDNLAMDKKLEMFNYKTINSTNIMNKFSDSNFFIQNERNSKAMVNLIFNIIKHENQYGLLTNTQYKSMLELIGISESHNNPSLIANNTITQTQTQNVDNQIEQRTEKQTSKDIQKTIQKHISPTINTSEISKNTNISTLGISKKIKHVPRVTKFSTKTSGFQNENKIFFTKLDQLMMMGSVALMVAYYYGKHNIKYQKTETVSTKEYGMYYFQYTRYILFFNFCCLFIIRFKR